MTPQESRLWDLLRNRALGRLKFRRQQPIDGYVADFCCFEKRLIIELDGAVHDIQDQKIYDQERDSFLRNQGFKILRFTNSELENNPADVLEKILESVRAPSPLGGRGTG